MPPELSAEPDVYIGHAGMRRYWESFHDALDEVRFELEANIFASLADALDSVGLSEQR